MFYNRNAGDPDRVDVRGRTSERATNDGTWKNTSLRLTLQATPQEHVQPVLGRADDPHRPSGRRHADDVAGGGGDERRGAAAHAPDHLALAGDLARAARGRLLGQRQPLGRPRARPDLRRRRVRRRQRHAQPDPRRRAGGQHPEPDLSLDELEQQRGVVEPVARHRVVRHRRAQPQGGLRGQLSGQQPEGVHQRRATDLPLQQRRCRTS